MTSKSTMSIKRKLREEWITNLQKQKRMRRKAMGVYGPCKVVHKGRRMEIEGKRQWEEIKEK